MNLTGTLRPGIRNLLLTIAEFTRLFAAAVVPIMPAMRGCTRPLAVSVVALAVGSLAVARPPDTISAFEETVQSSAAATVVQRHGSVRAHGSALADDDGPFPALGASLFWGVWGFRHDRARLEQNLEFLAEHGFDYVRCLGTVGGLVWNDRQMDPRWPDYDDIIAGLTDLAYDRYGLRVEWSIFGGTNFTETPESRAAVVDRFARMAVGREHKILLFEIGNESWQTGFPHPHGTAELRALAARLKRKLEEFGAKPILRAITSPAGPEHYRASPNEPIGELDKGYRATYEGAGADVGTVHPDRTYAEDGWRPVRLPWLYQFIPGMPLIGSNDEPIGPGASVASEDDPMRLVMAAVVTYVSRMAAYTYHTRPGIWGGGVWQTGPNAGQPRGPGDVWDFDQAREIVDGFRTMKGYLPPDLAAWRPLNSNSSGHPFQDSLAIDGQFWPDTGSSNGAVRVYAAEQSGRFVVAPIGVRGKLRLRAAFPVTGDVLHPLTGQVLHSGSLDAGEFLELEGLSAFVLIGHRR